MSEEKAKYQIQHVSASQWGMSDIMRAAEVIAKSGLFGMRKPEEAAALMLIAQAEGLHPAAAARDYHIIQGRPALRADAMLARFQAAGGVVEWLEYTDERVSARFSHPVYSPKPVTVTWDIERAQRAGLTGKDNWRRYPRQMLKARVISEGVRMTLPGAGAVGVYTPEEVADFQATPAPEVVEGEYHEAEPPAPKNPARPLAPAALRQAIAVKADRYRERDFAFSSDEKRAGARGLVATVLEEILGGREQRHELLAWLIGSGSLKDADDATLKALLDWLDPQRPDPDGPYLPNTDAEKEAHAAHRAALERRGKALIE